MKKSKCLILSILFILPIMLFSGCEDPKYFSVTSRSSNAELGSVSGGNNSWIDGTNITLVATARNPETNPFICWIKDYVSIYTFDSTFSLTVSESTQGNYTAVFEENSASSMSYALMTNLSYLSTDYSSIEYTMTYAPTNNTAQVRTISSGLINEEGKVESEVFRLFDGSNPLSYTFTLNLKITNREGTDVKHELVKDIIIDNSLFDENTGLYTFSNDKISFTVSKLSYSMFNQ